MGISLKTPVIGSLFVGFYVVLAYLVEAGTLAEFLNGVVFALSAAVIVAYIPAFWEALTTPRPSQKHYLLLGIVVSWTAIGLHRGEAMIWRALGKPEWMSDHWTWILFIYLNILGATLHLTAPGAIDGKVPTKNWVWWGMSVGLGIAVALGVLWHMGAAELPFFRGGGG